MHIYILSPLTKTLPLHRFFKNIVADEVL